MTQYVLDTFVGRGDLVLGAILCVALGVGGFGSIALGRGGALVVGAILGLAHGVGGFGSIAFVEGGVLVLGTNVRIRSCFGADCRVAPPPFRGWHLRVPHRRRRCRSPPLLFVLVKLQQREERKRWEKTEGVSCRKGS